MFEPQKEIEPMIAANRIGISASQRRGRRPRARNSTTLISATAPPPTPLNSATICGIAVIFTLRAAGTPTAVPIATPRTISSQSPTPRLSSVATTAIAMPTAATWLPRTAVRGPRSMCSPDDEHRERDDVEQLDDVVAGSLGSSSARASGSGFLPLNMPSIRSVTRKPPTTLIVPNAIAITSSSR